MIVAQVSFVPVGAGTSVGRYVREAINALRASGLKVVPNAMATVIEAPEIDDLFDAVRAAHERLMEMGVKRLITEIKIDDRRDKEINIESKLKSIEEL